MTRRIFKPFILRSAAIIAAFFLCGVVQAQDVTITSRGGNLSLTGRVIGFDGQYLQIESPYGPLSLVYSGVNCAGAACPDPDTYIPTIRMSGAARMGTLLLPALIDGFARSKGWTVETSAVDPARNLLALKADQEIVGQFVLRQSNSDEGFADLIAYQADISLSLREVLKQELSYARDAGIGSLDAPGQSLIIGLDALVPITSPQQSVTTLSIAQIAALLIGKTSDWAELGGQDARVSIHLGPRQDGQVQWLLDQFGVTDTAGFVFHDSVEDLSAAVAMDTAALGFTSYQQTGLAQPMTLKDTCGFVTSPRLSALKSQDYPLTAPLFLYFPEWRLHPLAQDFFGFLRTPAAQLIVRRAGFVDQGPVPISLDAQGQRFANAIAAAGPEVSLGELQRMVRVLSPLTRLSISFRFEEGSTRLDAQSRSQLLALAQAIPAGAAAGQTYYFVGFSDGRGDALANRDLSSARAEAVKRDLEDILGDDLAAAVALETEAFGEALPMACDHTEWGRQMNRRVELWVSQ